MSKYRVTRTRDGLEPEWPYFVLGAVDPAAEPAMRAYVAAAKANRFDAAYVQLVEHRLGEFEWNVDTGRPAGHRPDDAGAVRLDSLAPMDTFATADGIFEVSSEARGEHGEVTCHKVAKDGRRVAPGTVVLEGAERVWPAVVAASAAKAVVEVTADRRGTRFYIVATRCQNGVMLAVPDFKWSLTFSTHAPPSADYIRRSGFKNKVDAESLAELLHELVWPRLGLARVAR